VSIGVNQVVDPVLIEGQLSILIDTRRHMEPLLLENSEMPAVVRGWTFSGTMHCEQKVHVQ